MADFNIKQGDTDPDIVATLKDADGTAINLTGATVKFHMSQKGRSVVNAEAIVVDAAAGEVKYSWAAADTATTGPFDIEWEITKSGGQIETVPNSTNDTVEITAQLA